MAKRKTRPGGGSRKAPGVRKPKETPKLIGEFSPLPPFEELDHRHGGLTLRQEKFVYEYIRCGGNATEAYVVVYGTDRESSRQLASRMLKKQLVIDAIESKREKIRRDMDITLEEIVTRLVAMWRTGPTDLLPVFRSPSNDDSWRGLVGDKEFMVKEFSQGEFGNTVKTHSIIEVETEIRKILGLKKTSDLGDERDVTESVYDRVRELLGGGPESESR